ncbi:MAG: glutamyl-tRNA reductase [Pseudomonadota bacterium]
MIVVVGLSHRTAPIEIRERLSLPRERVVPFLQALVQQAPVGEAMMISTCNRVEIVAAGRNGADLGSVADACALALEREASGIGKHLYSYVSGSAVRHLFRVAASLDSLVVGEPQILGQVKDAFELARGGGTLGPALFRTLPRALRAAKRVRTETSIGSGQVSVPSVAVDLTRQIFGELRGRTALLVGSGEMAETVARLLSGQGARIQVVGRTPERVEELARAVSGEPRRWHELRAALVDADVVIASTSAPGYVIDYEMVVGSRRSRRGREQFYIDLAVPRDVDPRANAIDGVFVYNIDDLSQAVAQTLSLRSREAAIAEDIIEDETRGYERWAEGEQATPTIVRLRERVRAVLSFELSRTLRGRLKHLGPEERAALARMLEAVENRLLHAPTVRLRTAACEPESCELSFEELSQALNELFELDTAASVQYLRDEDSEETMNDPMPRTVSGEA